MRNISEIATNIKKLADHRAKQKFLDKTFYGLDAVYSINISKPAQSDITTALKELLEAPKFVIDEIIDDQWKYAHTVWSKKGHISIYHGNKNTTKEEPNYKIIMEGEYSQQDTLEIIQQYSVGRINAFREHIRRFNKKRPSFNNEKTNKSSLPKSGLIYSSN